MTQASALRAAALVVLLAAVVGLQVVREHRHPRIAPSGASPVLYVRSPETAARLALSYQAVLADVYWIRALQHYGRTRLMRGTGEYSLLYPLLDLTTTLDPRFRVAYRFGAIFLTEPPPGGPGRPDLAIALLEKGLAAQPSRWEFALDIGFVHYRSGDYLTAADWFQRASDIPGSPNWLPPLEAVTRARGGSREASRELWTRIVEQSAPEEEWLRDQAALRLRQLDALDQIDALVRLVAQYTRHAGSAPLSWNELIRAGALRGVPIDPAGYPYHLNGSSGEVTLASDSSLNPLPVAGAP